MTPASQDGSPPYTLEFYGETDTEDGPVLTWIKQDLTKLQRRSLGVAMNVILQQYGVGVCGFGYGKHVGGGIFEFRLDQSGEQVLKAVGMLPADAAPADHDPILLRVFCHAHGNRVVLLLHGYDKGKDPGKGRQSQEIQTARNRLELWKRGQALDRKGPGHA